MYTAEDTYAFRSCLRCLMRLMRVGGHFALAQGMMRMQLFKLHWKGVAMTPSSMSVTPRTTHPTTCKVTRSLHVLSSSRWTLTSRTVLWHLPGMSGPYR